MTKIGHYKTSRIFHRPSFIDGIASILSISGNYYEFIYSESDKDADAEALENDWGVVGDDIRKFTSKSKDELLQLQDS